VRQGDVYLDRASISLMTAVESTIVYALSNQLYFYIYIPWTLGSWGVAAIHSRLASMPNESGDETTISERATKIRQTALLPSVSAPRYDDAWCKFLQWKTQQIDESSVPNEEMLLVYFDFLSDQYASSSMWTFFSMIKKQMMVIFFFNSLGSSQHRRFSTG
jgi:hypothetical protein